MTALRRIQKELMDLQKHPVEGVHISASEENLMQWQGIIEGPKGSAYEKGRFKFEVTFPDEFPFKAPKVSFVTSMYHPNIDTDGSVCMGLLKTEEWKPATKLGLVLHGLCELLSQPNPDDALRSDVAQVYRDDHALFSKNAREWTKMHGH